MSRSVELRLNGVMDMARTSGDNTDRHKELIRIVEGVMDDLGLESYHVCEECSYWRHRLVRAEHSYVDIWGELRPYCGGCWPEQIANARKYGWVRAGRRAPRPPGAPGAAPGGEPPAGPTGAPRP